MSKTTEYTQLLQRLMDAFDFTERNWPMTIVLDESGYTGRAMVGEELADLLQEIRETLEDNGDIE